MYAQISRIRLSSDEAGLENILSEPKTWRIGFRRTWEKELENMAISPLPDAPIVSLSLSKSWRRRRRPWRPLLPG
jgi:hypothetical protein